jgi:hypothetical protein
MEREPWKKDALPGPVHRPPAVLLDKASLDTLERPFDREKFLNVGFSK